MEQPSRLDDSDLDLVWTMGQVGGEQIMHALKTAGRRPVWLSTLLPARLADIRSKTSAEAAATTQEAIDSIPTWPNRTVRIVTGIRDPRSPC